MPFPTDDERDRPWVIRTYAGHSSAATSNALYRRNLAKGQTGLSVAFDLPTQTGYDPDDELARGEVGKVGVPVSHIGDMRTLFDGIPLAEANTSMTINAPAMWLLALYVAVADEQGAPRGTLAGHHAERHRQGVPLARHVRVPARAQPAPDRRHDRLVGRRDPEVEPDQHLQLPPAGGGGHPRAGARLRAVHRDRRARRGARRRPGARPSASPTWSRASRSSSTRACGSSRRCARCARSPRCGTRSRASATASRTRASAGCATACRSTRWGSPRRSRRTTSSGSCWRCWRSRSRATPGPARSSSRPGTRRSACRGRGTSSGRCACSRCSPTRPTCWSTRTSSTARGWSRPRSPSSSPRRRPRSTGCRRWAARSRPSSPGT